MVKLCTRFLCSAAQRQYNQRPRRLAVGHDALDVIIHFVKATYDTVNEPWRAEWMLYIAQATHRECQKPLLFKAGTQHTDHVFSPHICQVFWWCRQHILHMSISIFSYQQVCKCQVNNVTSIKANNCTRCTFKKVGLISLGVTLRCKFISISQVKAPQVFRHLHPKFTMRLKKVWICECISVYTVYIHMFLYIFAASCHLWQYFILFRRSRPSCIFHL